MGALIKKAKLESGRHSFEASGPSLPFRTVNQAAESPVAAAAIKQVGRNVSSWPKCEVPTRRANVCSRWNCGRDGPDLSLTGSDPYATRVRPPIVVRSQAR